MRKLLSILLVLLLSAALLLPVQAATGSILYQNYDVGENTLSCYGISLPVGGTLSVSCGSESMDDAALSTIGQEDVPVTIYFLVDTATSLASDVVQQQEDILTVISSHLDQEDTMVLSTINEVFGEGRHLTDKEARQTAISTIGRTTSWKTNLSVGIEGAIDGLSASTAYHTNRFLVILSDGHDDGLGSADTQALLAKAQETHVPIFPVILGGINGQANAKDLEWLTQLSQAALGGSVYQLAAQKLSAAQAAENLWDTIQASSVIRFDASTLNTDTDSQLLIRYDIKDTRYEDTLLVRAVDLKGHITPPTTVPEEIPEETTETTEETQNAQEPEEEEEESNVPLIIACGAILVICVVAVVMIFHRKPKPSAETQPVADSGYTADYSETDLSITDSGPEPTDGLTYPLTTPVVEGVRVHLVAILHPEVNCSFTLAENTEVTLGRDDRSAIVLNGADRKLSGIHAGFLWDGVHLLVRDKNSTNGTFLNGVPCAGEAWYLVERGATIQAGGYDYRVFYEIIDSTNQ